VILCIPLSITSNWEDRSISDSFVCSQDFFNEEDVSGLIRRAFTVSKGFDSTTPHERSRA